MTQATVVDCRGLACPQPVLMTREALVGGSASFQVIVDNEASATNVRRFAESQGARVAVDQEDGVHRLTIHAGAVGPATEEPVIVCPTSPGIDLVAYVASTGMGQGDDELGAIHMAAFLDTLSQFRGELTHVILVNGGARLAVEGSPVLDHLRQLEEVGARVLVCGTCLRHFGIEDRLAVGSVSNMFAILETLTRARRTIRP